ncbi:conserved hypothetical protein [[Clostridium] ultunense Esp]|nr:conserved hypothetical protein [[Clostridium] ultunense Esp]
MRRAISDRHFIGHYRSLQDRPEDVEKCVEFLLTLVRTKGDPPPPIVEFVTLLKNEKPILYAHVRKRIQMHPNLRLLFEIDADYEQAKKRLNLG